VTEGAREQQGRAIGGMSRRTAAWLAWAMWVLSIALTALSLWLLVLCLSYPDVPVYSSFWAENVLQAIGFSTVGAVIVAFGSSKNPIGWLLCTMGLLFGAAHFAAQYANYAVFAVRGSLPGGEVAAWMWIWCAFLGVGLLTFLFLLFPDGRLPSSRWRWFARLSAFLMAAAVIVVAFSPGPIVVALPQIHNPFGIESLPSLYKPIQLFILLLVLVALASVLVRWVHARGVER
jgi:two-component system NarL family sensor kinase